MIHPLSTGRRQTESDVFAETVSTSQKEDSVSVEQLDVLTVLTQLSHRQSLKISISTISSEHLELDGFIQAVSMQLFLSSLVRLLSLLSRQLRSTAQSYLTTLTIVLLCGALSVVLRRLRKLTKRSLSMLTL